MPDFITESADSFFIRETAIAKFKRLVPKPHPHIIYIEACKLDKAKGIFHVDYYKLGSEIPIFTATIKLRKWA